MKNTFVAPIRIFNFGYIPRFFSNKGKNKNVY